MMRFRKHLKYPFKYPGILPRAVNNYWRMLILRQNRLRGIEFALNWECQCNCDHCSAKYFKRDSASDGKAALSTTQIVDAVMQCQELGAMNINFTGGEALLRDDLPELVRRSRPKSTVVSVATNGILLSREKVSLLAASGVRILTISLDSAHPETHDRIRNYPGCFEKAIAGSRYAMEAGLEVFFCTILTRENIQSGDIHRMVKLSRDLDSMLTINLPCQVGAWTDDDVLLGEAELEVHRELLKEPNVRWEGVSNYLKAGCPAGVEKLYISPAGHVMPCPFIHISFGNLTDDSLKTIWNRMLYESPFNRVHDQCLAAEDRDFIQSYLKPLEESEHYPLFYSCLKAPRVRRDGDEGPEGGEDP